VLNAGLAFPTRLYVPLGVSLRILKTRAPLAALLARASTFTPTAVRPECTRAVCAIAALLEAPWARQLAERPQGWPDAAQLGLIDKRFGGELTRADALGADAADDEEADASELLAGATTVAGSAVGGGGQRGSAAGSGPSGASAGSRRSRYSKGGKKQVAKQRIHAPRLPALDTTNGVCALRRAEADAARAARSLAVRAPL
jgi:hypothetical protein